MTIMKVITQLVFCGIQETVYTILPKKVYAWSQRHNVTIKNKCWLYICFIIRKFHLYSLNINLKNKNTLKARSVLYQQYYGNSIVLDAGDEESDVFSGLMLFRQIHKPINKTHREYGQ